MLVTSVVVETLPGKAHTVAERLVHVRRMGSLLEESDHCLVGTWRVPDDDTFDGLSEVLHAIIPEIVDVRPVPLGGDDPE